MIAKTKNVLIKIFVLLEKLGRPFFYFLFYFSIFSFYLFTAIGKSIISFLRFIISIKASTLPPVGMKPIPVARLPEEGAQGETEKRIKINQFIKLASKRVRLSKKLAFALVSFFFLSFLLFSFYFFILRDLPSPDKLITREIAQTTKIYDRYGNLLYKIYHNQNRILMPLEKIPLFVQQATIAIEDGGFYQHRGVSLVGLARVFYQFIFHNQVQGGSTITQQLVKNALLSPERTLSRKVKEMVLAVLVEMRFSKEEILKMYLNEVSYGGTAYGIEEASQLYFGKSAGDLTLAEATLLAGLPASPTTYSPFGAHPELSKKCQEMVLKKMVEVGFISDDEAQAAAAEKLNFATFKNPILAPHFVMYIKEQLVNQLGQELVERGGLRVTTTLDLDIQDFAQSTIASEVANLKKEKVNNGAALVTNPQTGEILAMVGSGDYFDQENEGNFNVTTALRQPGSAIKPLNYVFALEEGKITAATPLIDVPTCFAQTGQPAYCPTNYDYSYHGVTQARFALGNSYNIPAVKVLALNGIENFIKFSSRLGITTWEDPSKYGLSLTLGGGEVRMTDMATAFGVLANLGVKKPLLSILKIEDRQGKVLLDNSQVLGQEGERVVSREAAYIISHILLDNNARSAAFGHSSYLVVKNHPEVAVKTGTTNDKRDNWTIGYTPSRLAVVWVGNNDNSSMSAVASGLTGASPIWNKITGFVLEKDNIDQEWPAKPEDVIGISVCNTSGKLPGDSGCPTRFEYFIKGKLPEKAGSEKETILINKDANSPVQPNEVAENVEYQEHPVVYDPLGTVFCLDCPIPQKAVIIRYPI